MVYVVHNCSTNTQVNGIMTTTLERLTNLRLMQALVAAAVAALFIVAAAGMASADYGGSSNYPTDKPPERGQTPPAPPSPPVVSKPSGLPVTGGDALGLAALGVSVAGAGAGLVVWSRRREATPVNA